MAMALADFSFIKALVQRAAGNVLEAQRDYLVESRLQGLAERTGLRSVPALIQKVREERDDTLARQVIDALVNNETMFFRDITPFHLLRDKVLPEIMGRAGRERVLNIWSAACSSGQEPYSLAMLLLDHFPSLVDWQVRILASDCSSAILARAQAGRYSQIEANRGLPASLLVRYFDRAGLNWQIKSNVRQMVSFSEINLNAAWPALPAMDVIFMRNVLIYFTVEGKRAVLAKAERQLKPGGYLFLGAAETTISLNQSLERRFDKAACYQLPARSG